MSRIPTRHGQDGGHVIVRFQLLEALQPGSTADAQIVQWSYSDSKFVAYSNDWQKIKVKSTFNRSFGNGTSQQGEQGWALYLADSGQWEVISMEGSLFRHGQASDKIADGSSGSITIFYDVSGTDTTTGVAVTAKNQTGTDVQKNDKVFLWYEPFSKLWYIIGGAPKQVIVKAYSAQANPDTCLWPGKIAKLHGDPTAFCSDQFDTTDDCLLLILNQDVGSIAPTAKKTKLRFGDQFQGTFVCMIGDPKVPVYAIRVSTQQIYHTTVTTNVGPGATVTVSTPVGDVDAVNWSAKPVANGTPATVYQDSDDQNWYLIAFPQIPTPEDSTPTLIYHIVLPDDVAAGASLSVATPAGAVSALNWSRQPMNAGDLVTVYQDPDDKNWYLIKSGGASEIYPITIPTPGVEPNAIINVPIPGGRNVDARNWSEAFMPAEAKVNVYLNSDDDRWYLIRSNFDAPVRLYPIRLTVNIAAGGVGTVNTPDGAVQATNWTNGRMVVGDKVTAYENQDPADQTTYLIKGEDGQRSQFIKFKLLADLPVQNASANAIVLEYWGGGTDNTGLTITVNNILTNLAARYLYKGQTNSVGYATLDETANKWKIIYLERPALFIEGILSAQVSGTAATAATRSLFWEGRDPGANVSVVDRLGRFNHAPSGANFRAVWDDVRNQYYLIDCDMKARFITGRLNGSKLAGIAQSFWDGVSPASAVTLEDPSNTFTYVSDVQFMACYNPALDTYRLIWIAC